VKVNTKNTEHGYFQQTDTTRVPEYGEQFWRQDAALVVVVLKSADRLSRPMLPAGQFRTDSFGLDYRTMRTTVSDGIRLGMMEGSYEQFRLLTPDGDPIVTMEFRREGMAECKTMEVLTAPLRDERVSLAEIKMQAYLFAVHGVTCRVSNRQIAEDLGISEPTVERLIRSLAEKGLLTRTKPYKMSAMLRRRMSGKERQEYEARFNRGARMMRTIEMLDPERPGQPITYSYRLPGSWRDMTWRLPPDAYQSALLDVFGLLGLTVLKHTVGLGTEIKQAIDDKNEKMLARLLVNGELRVSDLHKWNTSPEFFNAVIEKATAVAKADGHPRWATMFAKADAKPEKPKKAKSYFKVHRNNNHHASYSFNDQTLRWFSDRAKHGTAGRSGCLIDFATDIVGFKRSDFCMAVDEIVRKYKVPYSESMPPPRPEPAAVADYSGSEDI
jgi:hypothetical protein